MAVNWEMGVVNPQPAFAAGNDYVDKLYNMQAQKSAGRKIVSGDFRGAAGDLASRGDVKGATALTNQATAADAGTQYAAGDFSGAAGTLAKGGDLQGAESLATRAQTSADAKAAAFQKQQEVLQRGVPFLTQAIQQGGSDPQIASQAFDMLAPHLVGAGTDPAEVAKQKQAFLANPQQWIQVHGAMAQKKYTFQKVGDDIAVFDENNPTQTPVVTFHGSKPPPAGYENGPAGPDGAPTLVPITGGPADPVVKKQDATDRRQVIVNNPTQPAGGADAELGDDDAKFLAEQLISGDTSVLQNVGRGAQGAKNVIKLRHFAVELAKSRGMSGTDAAAAIAEFTGLKAGERTLGTRGTQINLAADEAKTFSQQALAASQAVPRGNFRTLTRLIQLGQSETSDPALKKLLVAANGLVNAYSRAISPSGIPRVEDQKYARELLSGADGPEAFNAAVQQIMIEVAGAKAAPGNVKGEMRQNFVAPNGAPPQAAAPPTQSIRIDKNGQIIP